MNWKEHYQSLDTPNEEVEQFQFFQFPAISKPNRKQQIAGIALRYVRARKELLRAQDVRKVEPTKTKPNTLSTLIFQALSSSNKPQHINDIIQQVETLGWKSTSLYHKYSQFQHVLSNSYYMFEKVGVATYQIRAAYKQQPKTEHHNKQPVKVSNNIPSIKDVVEGVVKHYEPYHRLSAVVIHNIMYSMGVNCSYSAVRRALQDKRFRRNRKWYRLKHR